MFQLTRNLTWFEAILVYDLRLNYASSRMLLFNME